MKIKRIVVLMVLAVIILSLTGCSDESALQANAEEIVTLMINGDFASVTEQFSAEVAAQLSTEVLQTSWEETVKPLGAYLGHYQTSGEISDEYYVVQVISRFENNGLLNSISFNSSGKIAGLWFNYQTIEDDLAESDSYNEIAFNVGEFKLAGLLTLPTNVENPPVVLLIAGSGPRDKNETIGASGNAPFKDIAHGLAEQGVATLRYDKRYHTYPELAEQSDGNTVEAEVLDDAYAAIAQLADDDRIDSNRIFVLGHSLGGILTPKIAADNTQVAGMITMAGTLRDLAEISLAQNQEIVDITRPTLSDDDKATLDMQMAQVEADVAAILALTADDGNTYLGIPAAYWYSLSQAGGLHYLDQLDIPILVMQGTADFQVYPDPDYTLWQDTLDSYPDATFKLYEGLNHLFMTSSGLRTIEDYNTPNKVAEEVINDIATWVQQY